MKHNQLNLNTHQFVIVISHKEFKNAVGNICNQIAVSNWVPDYIVGITRGGLYPAVMISHYFDVPCHTLHVNLRDYDSMCETKAWMSEDAFGYNEPKKNILIVDDINDSGATINFIVDDWQSSCLPNDPSWTTSIWNENVRIATIVNNVSSNAVIRPDYYAYEIDKEETNAWVVFPWEEWWKH